MCCGSQRDVVRPSGGLVDARNSSDVPFSRCAFVYTPFDMSFGEYDVTQRSGLKLMMALVVALKKKEIFSSNRMSWT
jgi:hypothetical protein